MKKLLFIFTFFITINTSTTLVYCNTDSINDSATDIVLSDSNIENTPSKEEVLTKETQEETKNKNAQWFMYGFLLLGAFLVFKKFKNNQ